MRSVITKRRVRVAAFAALLAGASAMSASQTLGYVANTCDEASALGLLPIPGNPNHVTLCHFTGSPGNPFVINEPSLSAAATHIGHHDDCARFFDGHIDCGL
jgi:hypothetical protein